ncbi:hypothetical protein N7509_000752 [Penicillium cosmopolitanum]|uniref:Transcription factor domain-containing protein n=1 Tax=Penicillium cosmopolitanum TaxID=1131564 RepID=A0A9X0BEH1_9EURO|nr:uncharacterized protein N7509_000752 [Penicillium cosmopolitanum]KAJ5414125.1 hypothetical protein N7509_000752 [Penicillium cosmopolitanum]
MSSPGYGDEKSQGRPRLAAAPACEACRRLKVFPVFLPPPIKPSLTTQMKCTRAAEARENPLSDPLSEPCDRCKRTDRPCKTPESRPLGRRRGALGRYRGLEKAYRKLQAEAKKANIPHDLDERFDTIPLHSAEEELGFDSFLVDEPSDHPQINTTTDVPAIPGTPVLGPEVRRPRTAIQDENHGDAEDHNTPTHEPMSNPLALLAYASDAAQAAEARSTSVNTLPSPSSRRQTGPRKGESEGHRLLHRPGYVSLGLQLDRASLVQGLDGLLACLDAGHQSLDYFKRTSVRQRDVGPDLDPVELGLVTMDEANYLFPIYFTRLHPINGILDPMLHTPEFVRARSSLLFTWILTLTALFENNCAPIAERLRLHGEKLSRYVHSCGLKSVEIVQGYYISLLSATPAKTLAEERSWLYTMYAIGVATDLGMDQEAEHDRSELSEEQDDQGLQSPFAGSKGRTRQSIAGTLPENTVYEQRLLRNRERTWLRILLWDRANSAACGRIQSFPETNLTRAVETWWLHPLADMTDKYTSAFICLRRALASLQVDLKNRSQDPHSDPHWRRELVDASLHPWCNEWLSDRDYGFSTPSPEQVSMIFLRYVYEHGRLWTLSVALSDLTSRAQDLDAIRQDCFEIAINCCETAVRDLDKIGEPLYCMLAPTWAMISYAAVLTLKIFPALYGPRTGSDLELLALLSQVALQLQRAGTTPPHRFGIAALLGQHLMMILRARAVGIGDAASSQVQDHGIRHGHGMAEWQPVQPQIAHRSPLVSDWDPFLTPAISDQNDFGPDGFNDFFREIFGPGFGDLV